MTQPVQQGASPKPEHFQTNHTPVSTPIRGGVAEIPSAISSWGPVKTVRESTIWSWISWPFTATASFFKGLWTRFSEWKWGKPMVISDTVVVQFPRRFTFFGFLPSHYEEVTTTERAIRKGVLKFEEGMKQGKFTLEQGRKKGWNPVIVDQKTMMLKTAIENGLMSLGDAIKEGHTTDEIARINGWGQVTIDVPGTLWGSTPTPMMLKTAIQKGYRTVEQAIAKGDMKKEDVEQADWIKKN